MPKAKAVATKKAAAAPKSSGVKDKKKGLKTFSIKEIVANIGNVRKGNPRFFKRDLTHFVKWPRYVRMQRAKRVLMKRLKTPPALNQFNMPLDKKSATDLFRLLSKMKPEEKKQRKERRAAFAKECIEAKKANKPLPVPEKPVVVKYGLNHVTRLIENNKAKFVAIAHDVEPIELVVWLPSLCRKKNIPYVIVKGKARLGKLVHKKTASCIALTCVKKEDENDFNEICKNARAAFNDNEHSYRTWGAPILGIKRRQYEAKLAKRVKAITAKQ